jgi:hypothetical protein
LERCRVGAELDDPCALCVVEVQLGEREGLETGVVEPGTVHVAKQSGERVDGRHRLDCSSIEREMLEGGEL